MALSYLETLADLPWSRLSQAAAPPDGVPGGVPGGAPPPLPLGLVRHRLDEAHYGLDKVGAAVATNQGQQWRRGVQEGCVEGGEQGPCGAWRTRAAELPAGHLAAPGARPLPVQVKERIVQFVAVQRLR